MNYNPTEEEYQKCKPNWWVDEEDGAWSIMRCRYEGNHKPPKRHSMYMSKYKCQHCLWLIKKGLM